MKPSPATAHWQLYSTSFDLGWFGSAETLADDLRPAFDAATDLVLISAQSDYAALLPSATIIYRSPLPIDQAELAALDTVYDAIGLTAPAAVSSALTVATDIAESLVLPIMPALESIPKAVASGPVTETIGSAMTTVKVVAIAAAVLGAVYLVALLKPR